MYKLNNADYGVTPQNLNGKQSFGTANTGHILSVESSWTGVSIEDAVHKEANNN